MLNKIQGRPLWYKIWALGVAIIALYTLVIFVSVLFNDSFANISAFDYFLMAFVHISVLLDMYLFPETDKKSAEK